jgi:acetyl-CoA C-acetyltransferase
MVLMRASQAEKLGLNPVARIVGHTTHAGVPALFPSAPVGAMQKLFAKTGWTAESVDLYEINEAFAVVTMAALHDLKLDPAKVNITAAPAPSATRSVLPVPASSSPCSAR